MRARPMTSTPPPSPSSPESSSSVISDADLERLDELLSEPPYAERALPLDAMQGVFYALAMGPDEVPESTWMPAVLGADPDGEPEEIAAEVADLLRRFLAETANDVREGRFDLLLYENRMRRLDFAPWCGGFLDGLDIADTDWYEVGRSGRDGGAAVSAGRAGGGSAGGGAQALQAGRVARAWSGTARKGWRRRCARCATTGTW